MYYRLPEGDAMATFLNDSPVFGPVFSRRLGVSLGVNLMPASGKLCTFDCAYCECGLNADRVTDEGYVPANEVACALYERLTELVEAGTPPNVITFAGNGEPTASPYFPEAVRAAIEIRNELAPQTRIAVLSNGTRADRPAVHEALMLVDDNILKLDTVDPAYIALLDRPCVPYDVEQQIQTFASFNGHVIVQTMFLQGTIDGCDATNTGEAYVGPWLAALERIRPSGVTVYTVARETPIPSLSKAPADVLDVIAERVRALGIACSVSY